MEETAMATEWRTIQLFLDEDGIAEVEIDYHNRKKVRCNCKDFSGLAKCKHAKFVRNEMEKNGGAYKLNVPEEADEDEVYEALDDPEAFRQVIIKYGKVLVIK